MNNLPLQPLAWIEDADSSVAQHEFIEYRVIPDHDSFGKFAVRYKDSRHRPATGFATIDEAKAWAWNHYNEKMQPYVVPSPTKVCELTYDYGDGYFTVFMTTDKQQALDFIKSVKKYDTEFVRDYGFDDDADELLIEQYEDNHPLKPYASNIFNLIYEDSFSEWVDSYDGESLASQLSIIEHELFSTMQNNKGE